MFLRCVLPPSSGMSEPSTKDQGLLYKPRTSETSVNNNFTWQYIPEDNSEHQNLLFIAPKVLRSSNISVDKTVFLIFKKMRTW
jgi:hypothetical protein